LRGGCRSQNRCPSPMGCTESPLQGLGGGGQGPRVHAGSPSQSQSPAPGGRGSVRVSWCWRGGLFSEWEWVRRRGAHQRQARQAGALQEEGELALAHHSKALGGTGPGGTAWGPQDGRTPRTTGPLSEQACESNLSCSGNSTPVNQGQRLPWPTWTPCPSQGPQTWGTSSAQDLINLLLATRAGLAGGGGVHPRCTHAAPRQASRGSSMALGRGRGRGRAGRGRGRGRGRAGRGRGRGQKGHRVRARDSDQPGAEAGQGPGARGQPPACSGAAAAASGAAAGGGASALALARGALRSSLPPQEEPPPPPPPRPPRLRPPPLPRTPCPR